MAFYNCTSLKKIIIPENVININTLAFSNCDSLKEIILPKHVHLSPYVFSNCISLEQIDLPDTLNSRAIYEGLFCGCTSLTNIKLPECATIGKRAFEGCKKIKEITLPKVCYSIEDSAFEGCTSIKNINLPPSVQIIGSEAFSNCENLETIDMLGISDGRYTSAFRDDMIFDLMKLSDKFENEFQKIFFGCDSENTYAFGNLKKICSHAFNNCKKLNNIIIPDYVEFDQNVFEDCTSLKNITILNGLSDNTIKEFIGISNINLTLNTSLFHIDVNGLNTLSIENLIIYDSKRSITDVYENLREIREEELIDRIYSLLIKNNIFDAKCFKVSAHKKFINKVINNIDEIDDYNYRSDFYNYITRYINANKPKEIVEVKNIQSMLVDINSYELDNKNLNTSTSIEKYGNELLEYTFHITALLFKLQTNSKNNIETVNLNKILDKITKLQSRNPEEISKLIEKVFFDVSEEGFVLNKSLMNKLINYTRYKVGNLNDEIKGFETLKEIIKICIEKINICKDSLNQKEIINGEDKRLSNIDNNSIRNNISIKIHTLNNNEIMLNTIYEQINNLENLNKIHIDILKKIVADKLPKLLQNKSLNNVVLKRKEDIEVLNSVCETLRELIKLEENNSIESNTLALLDKTQEKTYKK